MFEAMYVLSAVKAITYVHTYLCTYIHTYTHTYVHIYIRTHILIYFLACRNVIADHHLEPAAESYLLKEQIYSGALVFYLKENTPWKHRFDIGIQRLVESGLVDKWYNDIMSQVTYKPTSGDNDASSSKERPLDLNNLQGPFMLLGVGLLLSVISFLIELKNKQETTNSINQIQN